MSQWKYVPKIWTSERAHPWDMDAWKTKSRFRIVGQPNSEFFKNKFAVELWGSKLRLRTVDTRGPNIWSLIVRNSSVENLKKNLSNLYICSPSPKAYHIDSDIDIYIYSVYILCRISNIYIYVYIYIYIYIHKHINIYFLWNRYGWKSCLLLFRNLTRIGKITPTSFWFPPNVSAAPIEDSKGKTHQFSNSTARQGIFQELKV